LSVGAAVGVTAVSRRMIDPSFWRSETTSRLNREQRLTLVGLISNADDQGRLQGHPALLRSLIYPYDDITLSDIEDDISAIATVGTILLYEVEGIRFVQLVNWWRYQTPSFAWPSKHPAPPGWTDRERYRRGNLIVENNWDGHAGLPDADPTLSSDRAHSDPTVTPEWAQSDPTVTPEWAQSDPRVTPEWAQSEPTVSPQWAQSEPTVTLAPNGNGNDNGSITVTTPASTPVSAHADGPGPPPEAFCDWLKVIEQAKNRPASLQTMFRALYPGRSPPDYSYLGRVARQVGGAGRLAELLWQNSSRPPTGDILAYCLSTGRSKPAGRTRGQVDPLEIVRKLNANTVDSSNSTDQSVPLPGPP